MPIFSNLAFGEAQNTLLIELGIRQINWAYSDQQHLSVGLDVKVTYYGSDPPKSVYLTASLPDTDPNHIGSMLDLTSSLGPWISIGNNEWVLNLTRDSQNLGHLPEYRFSIAEDETWPNEEYGNVVIFSAYTPRTVSESISSQTKAILRTINDRPNENYYYWLWANMPTNTSIMMHKEGADPTPDDPQGNFFSLVLNHDLTKVSSFGYVPLLFNTVYPVLTVVLFCAAVLAVIKRSKSLTGIVVTINFSMIILLLTVESWIKDYVPFWQTALFSTINNCLLWLIILLVLTVVLAALALAVGSRHAAYLGVNRTKPKLNVQVSDCRHGIRRDHRAFLLNITFRVHNTGDKDTTLTALEVSFVDGQGNPQHKTEPLKEDVDAGKSTHELEVLFSFIPPFPYAESIKCSFVLHNTSGKQTFIANSVQSDTTDIGKSGFFI